MRVITNNVPRLLIDAYDLTPTERAEFDYLNWDAIDAGEDSATFFRYKGQLYDLGAFMAATSQPLSAWNGYQSDTFFSATVVRYVPDDRDYVVVGRVYS